MSIPTEYHTNQSSGGFRPTIGFLLSWFGESYTQAIFSAAVGTAREREINLICFEVGRLHSSFQDGKNQILYDLVGAERLDGLVIFSEGMDQFVTPQEMEEFIKFHYAARLPVISIGKLEGVPSIETDLKSGMREQVSHLIEAHGCRRIAFIHGPESQDAAIALFTGYCEALRAHGLSIDPDLITPPGVWGPELGEMAVRILMDERGVSFEAIVGGDPEAIGALHELRQRGIKVPNEVAVAGYNDLDIARFASPPLTTVFRPVERSARLAIDMLLGRLNGDDIKTLRLLPTRMVVRRSCGCMPLSVLEAAVEPAGLQAGPQSVTQNENGTPGYVEEILHSLGAPADRQTIEAVKNLPELFTGEVLGTLSNVFISALEELLRWSINLNANTGDWHKFISSLRGHHLPAFQDDSIALLRAENLCHQARVMTWDVSEQARASQQARTRQYEELLRNINLALIATFDVDGLIKILIQQLPLLGITSCYLALYENPSKPAGFSKLILAYDERGTRPIELAKQKFPSKMLFPDHVRTSDRPYVMLVEPLYFAEEQLGFVVFEVGPLEGTIYSTLRGQISSALKGALLATYNIELYDAALKARQGAEEANRLKSRFLSMVSHELRTPISLIVGTIEMMDYQQWREVPDEFSQDVESIRAGAQHLSFLIGDVLDLTKSQAGELRLTRENLNLERIFEEINFLAGPMAREKGLTWQIETPRRFPTVWGDRVRLQQVILNLVSNAIKFTEQGAVTLKVETRPDEITVLVCDTGLGIPPEEHDKIFDEFWQSERTVQIGWGGMGLGLAISKQLVELHGGTIGVHSSGIDRSGSTFYFTLSTIEETIRIEDMVGQRSSSVLLLTEKPKKVAQVSNHLVQRGFDVEILSVHNEAEWLADVVSMSPGAVVLDFEPAMERGWELMRLIKGNPATQNVPVVFFSLLDKKNHGSILNLDYLTKPIGTAELARAIERQGFPRDCEFGRIILIVDDDPRLLDLHTRIVQANVKDCRVLQAHNGREALDIMESERPDLVLLDLMMPEIDGFGVIEEMQNRVSTRNVPIIVITGQILTYQEMERLQQGIAAVLGIGLFTVEEVLSQIESALCTNKQLGCQAKQVVRQSMAYIHERYSEPITRKDMADFVSVSPRYLTRCFHEETGLTPITYLNRYRIRQAKELLERGDNSVTEVAFSVGFSDSNYFGRVFRREVGASPSTYQHRSRIV